jgi:NADH dehydrogenase FAD-containing subunit
LALPLGTESKQLHVTRPDGKDKNLGYDFLILGTGSTTKVDTPFKSRGSTEATKEAIHDYQARIKAAETIVIVGAGPTGVEVAGELGSEYGLLKEIILVKKGPHIIWSVH